MQYSVTSFNKLFWKRALPLSAIGSSTKIVIFLVSNKFIIKNVFINVNCFNRIIVVPQLRVFKKPLRSDSSCVKDES